MKKIIIYFLVFGFFGCFDKGHQKTITENISEKKSAEYKQVLDGLRYDYILFYRQIRNLGIESDYLRIPKDDSTFNADSIAYYKSYQTFFDQDRNFIKWLLGFKNDTASHRLWRLSHNPMSSYMSECSSQDLSNSRAAIILLENYLNATGFVCYECKGEEEAKYICNLVKYKEIENFLQAHSDKSIIELRLMWREKNSR